MNGQRAARQRSGWLASTLGSALATAAALGLMFWARSEFQIRTLPERMLEWLLLFVPLELFERGLQQYGPQAKEIGLVGAIVVMAALLFGLGLAALRLGWPDWALLLLGPALWLLAMGGIMPLTGAGPFASGLFQNVYLVNASYFGVALAYATVLLLAARFRVSGSALRGAPEGVRPAAPGSEEASGRRSLLVGLGGLAASYLAVIWFARQAPTAGSSLPLAKVQPPATASPAPAGSTLPPAAQTAVAAAQRPVEPTPAPTAAPAAAVPTRAVPTPTPDGLPTPPPPRQLSRDKDGSLTATGRKPGELAPLITSNQDFYVVTKNAAGDPLIKPEDWRCLVDGEVNNPVQLDYRSLRQLPSVEVVKTLECISNFTAKCELTSFGCDLISTARWKGVRLTDLLDLAGGLKPSAVALAVLSSDEFTSALPLEVALDPETLLVYEMNGEVLPYEHGYPARLLAPGRYGFKSAKWVVALRPMSQQFADWYGQRNWNREGIVKTMARIDQPTPGAELGPGGQRIAGIAYAGNRGLRLVELSLDGGQTWQPASLLEPAAGPDAWLRWQASFNAEPGAGYTLVVRATDGTGEIQTETFSLPQPDGGSGRHAIEVRTRPA
jgi:DMSO/TMAO reductase YedYZ molybdopterin-dependent catalytic subunit